MMSLINRIRACIASGLLLASVSISADETDSAVQPAISLAEILVNTLAYHPKTEMLQAKLEQRQAKQQQAEGAFDLQLEHRHQSRGSGYYDGWFSQQYLSRQLAFANAKLQVGYRNSEGTLPVYEDEYRTLDKGEPNLKLSLSLLRNRAMDPKRQALQEASIGVALEGELQRLSLNDLLAEAAQAYLSWYLSHRELSVAQQLLQLAETRKVGITQRVTSGDLAQVVELEFESTLFSRSAKVIELRQKLDLASLKLSLYRRDNQGQPIQISSTTQPAALDSLSRALDQALANLNININQHPRVQALNLRARQLQSQRKLSRGDLLPELDVQLTLARDLGEGSETLQGNESYLGLKFTAPIERRKAKGKLRAVEAEIKAVNSEQQLTREYLNNMLLQQETQLRNQQKLLQLRKQQAALTEKLAKVEMQRFQAGDSDLFLLNAREIASAEAKLQVAQTFTSILRQKMTGLAQVGQLSELTQSIIAALPSD
ncbi:MAG: TolC family protein [Cellvibrionaceae bacterium]|nr:TolC family protein [Cellvibrionaceae bacterium]